MKSKNITTLILAVIFLFVAFVVGAGLIDKRLSITAAAEAIKLNLPSINCAPIIEAIKSKDTLKTRVLIFWFFIIISHQ